MDSNPLMPGQKRLWPFIYSASAALILSGCGGGGGSSTPSIGPAISGNNVEFAVVAADMKAAAAGAAGPLTILAAVDSSITPAKTRTPTFVAFLGLYLDQVVGTGTVTLNYSTTANGGHGSGQIVITNKGNNTYEAKGSVGGTMLPFTTDMTVVLTDTHGANTINGTLDLTGQKISVTMTNLSGDDSGNIGNAGEMDIALTKNIQGLGPIPTTTVFNNFSGQIAGNILGNVSVTGAGLTLTGSGTLNLPNGTLNLQLKDPSNNPFTAAIAAAASGTVTFLDGTSISVQNLLTFDLASLSGASGGLPGSSSGAGSYQAPVLVPIPQGASSTTIWQALPNGQMVGAAGLTSQTALYWASPTSAPVPLPVPVGVISSAAYGIASFNGTRVVVGQYTFNDGYQHACEWTSSAATGSTNFNAPTGFSIDGTFYPNGGVAKGISPNGQMVVGSATNSLGILSPVVFGSGKVYGLPIDTTDPFEAIGVDNSGDILGTSNGNSEPEIWVGTHITNNALSTTEQDLLGSNSSNIPATEAFHISPNGVVVGAQVDGHALIWKNDGGGAWIASKLTQANGEPTVAYCVSADGTQFAGAVNPTTTGIDVAYWSSATTPATDVSTGLPSSSYTNIAAFQMLTGGSFICLGQNSSNNSLAFVYIQKK